MPANPHAAAVGRHYDTLDGIYRRVWGEHLHHGRWVTAGQTPEQATRALVELVAAEADVRAGTRVCDVGCGYGAGARLLSERHGARVTGLTLSPAQQRYAAAAGGAGGPRILLGDWLSNGLPDASFDAVIAIESVSHMPERRHVFAECHRVLAPGGRLAIADWLAPARPRGWQRRHIVEPICREGHLPRLDSLGDYVKLALQAGFVDVRGRDLSAEVWRTWPLVLGRGAARLHRDPELRRLVFDRHHPEHRFVAMVARIMLGYGTRGFRYGLLSARRPAL